MRSGSIYRRCGNGHRFKTEGRGEKGQASATDRRCPKCRSDSITWGYAVDISRPRTAKRRQLFKSGFKTKHEAALAMSERLAEQRTGHFRDPSRTTVSQFFEEWLKTLAVEDATAAGFTTIVRGHITPHIGDLLLADLTTTILRKFYAERRQHGNLRTGGTLSWSTVKRIHGVLNIGLKTAVPDQLPYNPAAGALKLPRGSSNRQTDLVWRTEELARFFIGVGHRPDYALWRVLAMTGARRGEILGLTWANGGAANPLAGPTATDGTRRRGVGGAAEDSGEPFG